jgi:hypothetical protein
MYGFGMMRLPCNYERIRLPDNGFIPVFADEKYKRYKNAERILTYIKWDRKLINFRSNLRGGEIQSRWTEHNYKADGMGEMETSAGKMRELLIEIYGDKYVMEEELY